jgi:hypothetical protein
VSAELSARYLRFDCCLMQLLGLHLLLLCHRKLEGIVLLCFFSHRLNLVSVAACTRIAGCSCIAFIKVTVSLHSGRSESGS